MTTTSSSVTNPSDIYAALNAQYSSVGKTSSTTDDPNSAAAIQSRFLTMLTTQLQNQDPMNPMDNSEITSQMAQLSTVSGIEQMNETMQSLSSTIAASQTISAASMLGHNAMVPGNQLSLSDGTAVGGIQLAQAASDVDVSVKDGSGNTVATVSLGAQQAGILPFAWNGQDDNGNQLADGTYTFSVQATTSAGAAADATALSFGAVNAVTPTSSGVSLNVGSFGDFSLSDIKQLL